MKSEVELKFLKLLRMPIKSAEEIKEMERLRNLLTTELKQEIEDLSKELTDAGAKYTDPWDMINTKDSYPEAIDILVKHLPKEYHHRNKEGIVRALTVKEAKGKANAALIAEYNKISKGRENDSIRWAIGNAIWFIIIPNDVESILTIVEDKLNGMSRHRFVEALGKVKSEKAESVLIQLLDDEVAPFALRALGRMKSKKAKEKISLLINNPNELIKKEAQKALKRIG
ncbi:MAG: HEAT repeat domain-containing protein [Mucilaginibacter sp.]